MLKSINQIKKTWNQDSIRQVQANMTAFACYLEFSRHGFAVAGEVPLHSGHKTTKTNIRLSLVVHDHEYGRNQITHSYKINIKLGRTRNP